MSATNTATALAEALLLAARGLACLPCSTAKRPTCPHGLHDASAAAENLCALWRRHPGPLVGVRTGVASGIDVLDLDQKHLEARAWWIRNRRRIPPTLVHRTRSGGLHLIFRHVADTRCSAGRIARGVDVRGDGGYAIWWPAAGFPVLYDMVPAPWPEWLRTASSSSGHVPALRPTVPDDHSLASLIRLVAGAAEGERNSLAYWAACRLGERVASKMIGADTAAAIIAEAAIRAGLPRLEAERTARSGIRATSGAARA